MKKTLTFLVFIVLAIPSNAQKSKTAKDSIKVFYAQLYDRLKKEFIYKKDVEWAEVITATDQALDSYEDLQSSLGEIQPLFNKIGANHCTVYFNNSSYSSSPKSIGNRLSEQWKAKYANKPTFEVKVIDGSVGYILMPKIIFSDISEKNIHKVAQPLYDQIANLKSKNQLKGWIIDLRFNTGGNSFPMLLALYDFLGNNEIAGSLGVDKVRTNTIKLMEGVYTDNGNKVSFINKKGQLMDSASVAIITGPATASAGEMVAAAFKGRNNTIFIGQETYGATTGNIHRKLPFGGYMALTTSYNCDRNGKYHETILPDVVIEKQDDFENLLLDRNVQEVIKFIGNH